MFASARRLRARILTPDPSETSVEKRGFVCDDPEARTTLETVGTAFLDGYAAAAAAGSEAELEGTLELVATRYRGFAYEGAAMGAAMVDALPVGGGGHVRRLLAGRGDAHVYMCYVGVGWAMARLPRVCWPDTRGYDPTLRWLILDGYGFHEAYFHTDAWVHGTREGSIADWPGWDDPHGYGPRAIDQGIGRALWFVGGTDPSRVADLLERYPERRRPDLWSGVGLAATYAGGPADVDALAGLCERAGEHRSWLALGSAFAAEARERAGLTVPHVGRASRVLTGLYPDAAAARCRDLRPSQGAPAADEPVYGQWRSAVAASLVPAGGVSR